MESIYQWPGVLLIQGFPVMTVQQPSDVPLCLGITRAVYTILESVQLSLFVHFVSWLRRVKFKETVKSLKKKKALYL